MPTADRWPRLPSHTLTPSFVCTELSLRPSKGRHPTHPGLLPRKHHTAQGPCPSVSRTLARSPDHPGALQLQQPVRA